MIVINTANEQNSPGYEDSNGNYRVNDPRTIVRLCDVVRAADPGCAGFNHRDLPNLRGTFGPKK